jgi:hypothetical protein
MSGAAEGRSVCWPQSSSPPLPYNPDGEKDDYFIWTITLMEPLLSTNRRRRNVWGSGGSFGLLASIQFTAIAILLSVSLPSCDPKKGGDGQTAPPPADEGPIMAYPNSDYPPSIVQLLANPEKYHTKSVRVEGYLRVEFEGTAIYLSKESAEYFITCNGFWVSFDPNVIKVDTKQFDKQFVLIEGTFNKDSYGHLSAWKGTIEKVSRLQKLKRQE